MQCKGTHHRIVTEGPTMTELKEERKEEAVPRMVQMTPCSAAAAAAAVLTSVDQRKCTFVGYKPSNERTQLLNV